MALMAKSDTEATAVGEDFDMRELAERLASLKWSKNATYADPPPAAEFVQMPGVEAFYSAVATGDPVMLKGSPGIGKTSMTRDLCQMVGLELVVINAPNVSPEELALPMPRKIDGADEVVLDFMLYDALLSPNPKIILVDEISRASTPVKNQLMELIQEKRLADIPLVNVVGIIACDNVTKEDGVTKGYDPALATRFGATYELDSTNTPWRRALAAKYHDVDLKGVYRFYASLTPRLRYLLSPRTLDHVIWNLLHGLPGEWGLPMIKAKRQYLVDENGVDKTSEILDKVASELRAVNRPSIGEPFERAIKAAVEHGVNLYIEGPPGIGKTAAVRQFAEETGYNVLVLSTPVVSPENLAVPFPVDGRLDLMLMRWFATPGKKILVFDEIWRCSPQVRNKVMEILQERTLGGKPIPDLVCVIALNNPPEIAGHRMDVGKPDRAQADRFYMSLSITASDVPWPSHLWRKYGETSEPFIEWWKEELDDVGRVHINARVIESLIKRHTLNLPLDKAKPHLNGEYVPVSFHKLEQMLANRAPARLKSVVQRVDEYEERLKADDGSAVEANAEVLDAFMDAELERLEENRDVCVRLVKLMNDPSIISLIRREGRIQKFWVEVLKDAKAPKAGKSGK